MKAIQIHEFGEPEVLQYVDIANGILGSRQVRVRAKAIGIGKPDALFGFSTISQKSLNAKSY